MDGQTDVYKHYMPPQTQSAEGIKIDVYNSNLDLVNINAYAKLARIHSNCSQDTEGKLNRQ